MNVSSGSASSMAECQFADKGERSVESPAIFEKWGERTWSPSHHPNPSWNRRSKPLDETNQVIRVVVPSGEAKSPDHDDRSSVFVKVGRRGEDLLVVNL